MNLSLFLFSTYTNSPFQLGQRGLQNDLGCGDQQLRARLKGVREPSGGPNPNDLVGNEQRETRRNRNWSKIQEVKDLLRPRNNVRHRKRTRCLRKVLILKILEDAYDLFCLRFRQEMEVGK